jgi:hypothetical protein
VAPHGPHITAAHIDVAHPGTENVSHRRDMCKSRDIERHPSVKRDSTVCALVVPRP